MKQILGTAVIASALSVGAIDAANANNIETTTSEKQTVCNTDTIVKNARNRTFGLIEGWETGKNRLTYCRQGQLMMSAPTATGKPHGDGGVYTPEGIFPVGRLEKNKVSGSYKNSQGRPAAMPNAVQVVRGIYAHAGRVFDGKGNVLKFPSHGCIRLTHTDSAKLFNFVQADKKTGTQVEMIIKGTDPRK